MRSWATLTADVYGTRETIRLPLVVSVAVRMASETEAIASFSPVIFAIAYLPSPLGNEYSMDTEISIATATSY